MPQERLITLPSTSFLYTILLVLLVPALFLLVISYPYGWGSYWCERFQLPEYEKAFGFRFGPVELPRADRRGTETYKGIVWLAPEGTLACSGVRVGDIPRTHHGIGDFCGALEALSNGEVVEWRFLNKREGRPRKYEWREVRLAPTP